MTSTPVRIHLQDFASTARVTGNTAQQSFFISGRPPQHHCKNLIEILSVLTPRSVFLANLLALVSLAEPAELLSKWSTLRVEMDRLLSLIDTSALHQRGAGQSLSALPSTF